MDRNPLMDNATALVANLKRFDKQYNDLSSEIMQQGKDKVLLEENINMLSAELDKILAERDAYMDKRDTILYLLEQAEAQKERMGRDYSALLANLKKERDQLF